MFSLIGIGVLFFHFIMVIIYVYNDSGPSSRFLHYNQKYVVPAFHQKWPLFAPNPANYNCILNGRYYENGQWSDWIYTDSLREKHYKIKHLESTLASDLTNTINSSSGIFYIIIDEKPIPQFDKLEKTYPYNEVYFYLQRYFSQYHSNKIDSIQVRLNYTFAPDFYTKEIQEPIALELNAKSTHAK